MPSIGALGGDCTLPGWSLRPGAVPALEPVGEAMLLWQIIASINGNRCTACFASEDELARLLKYVEGGGTTDDSDEALGDVFWVLLNSSEFLVNG